MTRDFSQVQTCMKLVTRQMAAVWLTKNIDNRKKRPDIVKRYAKEAENGHWLLSDSAICFDEDDLLINGQHRLEMIDQTGISQWFIVATNMPRECFRVMDQLLPRKVHEILKMSGFANADTQLGALLNSLKNIGERAVKLTASEAVEFFERHTDTLSFTLEHCKHGHGKGTSRATFRAAIARAYYHVDHIRLAKFARLVTTNDVEMEAGNEAAYLIKNYLQSASGAGGRETNRNLIHRKTERAIQAFVNREQITKLFQAADELYPLPEERAAERAAVQAERIASQAASRSRRPQFESVL